MAGDKSDCEKFGVFKDSSYISIGDPYQPKRDVPSNVKGKQFLTSTTRTRAATVDGYFDKFSRVMDGEASYDPVKASRKERLESKTKNVVAQPFVSASVGKKLGCPGGTMGTFSGKVDHMDATLVEPKPREVEKKNFYTNPAKRGTGYGYLGVTIGGPIKYESDPYDAAHELALKQSAEEKAKLKGGAFKTHTAGQDLFDGNPYKDEKGSARAPPPETEKRERTKTVPFYTTKPGLSMGTKHMGTFDKYPAHSDEPPRERAPHVSEKVFKPPITVRTRPTKSVMAMHVTRTINPRTYTSSVH